MFCRLHSHKIFRQIPSAPDLPKDRPALFAKGFQLHFPGFVPSLFKIQGFPGFATKDSTCNICLISVQLHAGRNFYDKWSTS